LSEEDKTWILEMLNTVQLHQSNDRRGANPLKPSISGDLPRTVTSGIEQMTKTSEQLVISGVKLAGLGLSVIARISQVTSRAVTAGVDVYVDELSDAMKGKHERTFPLS
jgi:O-succinylbenzoate synthase